MKKSKFLCISCQNGLFYVGENDGIKIYQCSQCGLGVTKNESENEFYHEYHRDPVYASSKDQFRNIFSKRVQIISQFKTSGKVLEVGSSTGLFLSLLKEQNWEVLGIEPSSPAARIALKDGIPTLNTTFEQANLPKGVFDVVIFNHVLEHMESPKAAIKKVNSLLRKDGIIFIDVPNFASLSARLGKASWQYVLPKEHRWHFTPVSLFRILERNGFRPLYWEAHSGIWDYAYPMQELWQSLTKLKKRFFTNIITAIPTYILTKLKMGTGLTIVAQKVGGR